MGIITKKRSFIMAVSKNEKNNRRTKLLRRRILVFCILAVLICAIAFGAFAIVRSCRTSLSKQVMPFSTGSCYAFTGDGFLYANDKKLNFLCLADEKKSFSSGLDSESVQVAWKLRRCSGTRTHPAYISIRFWIPTA